MLVGRHTVKPVLLSFPQNISFGEARLKEHKRKDILPVLIPQVTQPAICRGLASTQARSVLMPTHLNVNGLPYVDVVSYAAVNGIDS